MDPDQASQFAVGISAIAANKAIIRLCAILAAKDVINMVEVEAMRHLHLREFDAAIEMPEAPASGRQAVDEIRKLLESEWRSAEPGRLSAVLRATL